jgi:hypothetical protein
MRLKLLALLAVLGATALPASAQTYQNCGQRRADNGVGGMILGGILGGVLGSNVAAHGHRGDGTAVGAVLGGIVGSSAGRSGTDCQGYASSPGYAGPGYAGPAYGGPGYSPSYPADYPPATAYPGDQGSYPERGYGDDGRYNDDHRGHGKRANGIYGNGNGDYKRSDDYAGRDCSEATQITRLPDGSEIRRPVQACRDSYYGDWQVQN